MSSNCCNPSGRLLEHLEHRLPISFRGIEEGKLLWFAAAAHYNFSGSCWAGNGGFGTVQPAMGAHHAETHKDCRVDLSILLVGSKSAGWKAVVISVSWDWFNSVIGKHLQKHPLWKGEKEQHSGFLRTYRNAWMTGIPCVSIGFAVIQLNSGISRAGTKGGFHPDIMVMRFFPQCMSHLCPLSSQHQVVDGSCSSIFQQRKCIVCCSSSFPGLMKVFIVF